MHQVELLNKPSCTGCSACMNKCPKNAICMEPDKSGFLYPFINRELCINCGMCKNVCPVINNDSSKRNEAISVHAVWSKDQQLRFQSTSGGFFSELAYLVIDKGGIVVGAAYDKECQIKHVIVTRKQDVERIRQSKYAQSNIGYTFRAIKENINDKLVLFSGTPCQVAALIEYIGGVRDNLITMDFICRGVNSPKAFRAWLNEIEEKNHACVNRVWFKYKDTGWKKSPKTTRIDLNNGKTIIQRDELNPFMYGYLVPNLFIRPSCGECVYKGQDRLSDITVGDFWGIDKSFDDDGGTSMVQINTNKGKMYFDELKNNINAHECSLEDISKGNIMFNGSVKINPSSDAFFESLDAGIPFSKLVERYSNRKFKALIKYRIKKVLQFVHR